MKQFITEDQYSELTKAQKQKWFDWATEHKHRFGDYYSGYAAWSEKHKAGDLANFPSIGQMIEFLEKKFEQGVNVNHFHHGIGFKNIVWDNKEELCDALWMEVKLQLDK